MATGNIFSAVYSGSLGGQQFKKYLRIDRTQSSQTWNSTNNTLYASSKQLVRTAIRNQVLLLQLSMSPSMSCSTWVPQEWAELRTDALPHSAGWILSLTVRCLGSLPSPRWLQQAIKSESMQEWDKYLKDKSILFLQENNGFTQSSSHMHAGFLKKQ